jgi:hypothetical protein
MRATFEFEFRFKSFELIEVLATDLTFAEIAANV